MSTLYVCVPSQRASQLLVLPVMSSVPALVNSKDGLQKWADQLREATKTGYAKVFLICWALSLQVGDQISFNVERLLFLEVIVFC